MFEESRAMEIFPVVAGEAPEILVTDLSKLPDLDRSSDSDDDLESEI